MQTQLSIIIPAYNAAETLWETLNSVFKQTRTNWEIIIVDDGSIDNTLAIANEATAQDPRVRVTAQPNQGVSAARNRGASLAQTDWLLFLDADDWIAPNYLEEIFTKMSEDPLLDAIHCRWVRVASDGSLVFANPVPQDADLFNVLAHYCPFAIHSCVVKKKVFHGAGGFDTSLKTCEDWDLWQRIARQGACFGGIPDVLAYYRMRPQSLSYDGTQFFLDGLRVLKQGHAPDSRVSSPAPTHKNGFPADNLSSRQFQWAAWPAGLVIGLNGDTKPLLNVLDGTAPGLDPVSIAASLFESIPLPTACPPTKWWQLWENIYPSLQSFLVTLETATQTPGLVQRVNHALVRMIFEQAGNDTPWPLKLGSAYGLLLEITQPITDVSTPAGVERLYAIVTVEGQRLGMLELPVFNDQVSQVVLKDLIAAQFCWPILGYFYQHTVYQHQSTSVHTETNSWQEYHNQVGWTFFLQDLWDRPGWSGANFYDENDIDASAETLQITSNEVTLEISSSLPNLFSASTISDLRVTLTVGGIPFNVFTLPAKDGCISAQALRVAITTETGLELCRVVVREALLGEPLTQGTLRERLAIATQSRKQYASSQPYSCSVSLAGAGSLLTNALVLGQRDQNIGSSASRWAILPARSAKDLLAMANIAGERIAQIPDSSENIHGVIYAPDALSQDAVPQQQEVCFSELFGKSISIQTGFNNRDHFETLFAVKPDPWKYTNSYEQVKYEQTLSLLPKQKIVRALELACAEGHFTVQLAPYVQSLIATDISQIAVERASQRCSQFSHIQFQQMDMAKDPLPGPLQLIVCSEVLYYIGGWEALHNFAQKVVDALEPGGYFLTAHAHLVVDEPDRPGYSWDHPFGAKGISDAFMQIEKLDLIKEIRTPLYRVQLYQKAKRRWFGWKSKAPSIVELPQPTPPPDSVASLVLWNGGQPRKADSQPITTDRLPILMYHRIAPSGREDLSQWRLSPEKFAEQLNYLRDAGYYTVNLGTWQNALSTKQPLPGRAILLTFDDGYLDFLEYAYPILQKYGFSATVFLVTDCVGQSNQWDAIYGEEVPLMDWSQIRELQAQGIEFGSHTATHRYLTALSAQDIVSESARSRRILMQELGRPIQSIAYPYGDVDPVVQHLVGACGYTVGLSCRSGHSSFQDSPLLLPRIEIEGSSSLQEFIKKLHPN